MVLAPTVRRLHSIGITLLSLPEFLTFSKYLVHLQVDEIPGVGYFSPKAFANTLSGMTKLRSLSLHFISLPSRRNSISIPRGTRRSPCSWILQISRDQPGLGQSGG